MGPQKGDRVIVVPEMVVDSGYERFSSMTGVVEYRDFGMNDVLLGVRIDQKGYVIHLFDWRVKVFNECPMEV